MAIVHGLPHVQAAIAQAHRLGVQGLTLVTARGAPDHAGAAWCAELERLAKAQAAGLALDFITDCADSPGRALEAIACGAGAIALEARADVFARIEAIAAQAGGRALPRAPRGLDFGALADATAACREAWHSFLTTNLD